MGAVRQLTNAGGVWGGDVGWGAAPAGSILGKNDQVLMECLNNSGGTLTHGDVVVFDVTAAVMPAVAAPPVTPQSGGYAVTTVAGANSPLVCGVVSITGDASSYAGAAAPAGGVVMVCIAGVARVNIGGNTVAANALLGTSAVAKIAAASTPTLGLLLGIALEAQTARDAQNTIRCIIKLG